MDPKLIEKVLRDTATPRETKKVLDWFETPGGRECLVSALDADFDLMDDQEIRDKVPELDSKRLYRAIQSRTLPKQPVVPHKLNILEPMLKIAAAILVIAIASVFSYTIYEPVPEEVAERNPIYFRTAEDQQREILLRDGTVVHLNSNSEIVISEDFMRENREVTLSGEAYFDVESDPEQPFIIHANQSSIRVLGTAFNVKSISDRDNVQVAVVEGRVSFASTRSSLDEHSVELVKGQYGYMDVDNQSFTVDDLAVENYLAWRRGRLTFEDRALEEVCTQLTRIYEVRCGYEKQEFRDLRLTADFSSESMEKTLSVISLTLKLDYEHENGLVYWIDEESSQHNPGAEKTGSKELEERK